MERIVIEIDKERKDKLRELAFTKKTTMKNILSQAIDAALKKGIKNGT